MKPEMKRGLSRLCMLLAVVWIAGMGWYQMQDAKQVEDNSISISIGEDKEFRIDATGVKQESTQEVQAQRIALIVLPALLLLLIVPIGGWVSNGFKPGAK